MMRGVPQNDVDQCPSAGAETIRSPETRPRGWRDAIHECQRARSLQRELRNKFVHAAQIELARGHRAPLVELRHSCHIAAADPKEPVGKDSFRIEKVTDHLLDRPLPFSVAKHRV